MFGFIRRRNAALWPYRRKKPAVPTTATGPARPNQSPAWATEPTVAFPRPGRAGWLTPAQTWRANGGRW
ncbi:hypothetical protein [Micromonospora narathiwatensis]|uniref:Uncharacterized protein n=1 Tax=Micromonospora narathiwatensis TaxID=299146 RepID=A0A1A9AA20_9ACTN|nr:hypothetical protein [Micromonospora narathiwatensis]SBT53044.1 hypothetical protein GA0070621_4646 [Micromonospora narathiwatensis]